MVQAGAEDAVGVSGGDHNLSRSVVGVDALGVSGEASECRLLSMVLLLLLSCIERRRE